MRSAYRDMFVIGGAIVLLGMIFFPVAYTTYFFTDEVAQLFYREGNILHFITNGCALTGWLLSVLLSDVRTIADLTALRLISWVGWAGAMIVWGVVLSRCVREIGLSFLFVPLTLAFVATSLTVALGIGWVACIELSLSYTAGLVSGYCVYEAGKAGQKSTHKSLLIALGVVAGLVSLFFYQNGFGCFLIPFFLQLFGRKVNMRSLFLSVAIYLAMYVVYFFLFRLHLWTLGIEPAQRVAEAGCSLWSMATFLFPRPLGQSFFLNVFYRPELFHPRTHLHGIIHSLDHPVSRATTARFATMDALGSDPRVFLFQLHSIIAPPGMGGEPDAARARIARYSPLCGGAPLLVPLHDHANVGCDGSHSFPFLQRRRSFPLSLPLPSA